MRPFQRKYVDEHRPLSRRLSRLPCLEALEDRCLLSASLVRDINPGPAGSNAAFLSDHNGTLLFGASGGAGPYGLWRSDGTEAGTTQLVPLGGIREIVFANGITYVSWSVPGAGLTPGATELWRTDGTVNGTQRLFRQQNRGAPRITEIEEAGGTVYFLLDVNLSPPTLQNRFLVYRLNGDTPQLVANIGPVSQLTNSGGTLFFTTMWNQGPGFGGEGELWKIDGTTGGTVRVKDINPGADRSLPQSLTDVNGILYFTADDGVHGRELWRSDGTEAGTVLVADLNPFDSSFPNPSVGFLTNINGVLVFSADDGQNGVELWVSYGTADTTYLVADIAPGPNGSWPAQFMELNGWVYFAALTAEHGYELWASNGTAEGTYMVRDINPGPDGSFPDKPVAFNGLLYFSAEEPGSGRELWVSDATPDNTALVADVRPGALGSDPLWLTVAGSTLFFTADDGVRGIELWKVDAGSGPSGGAGDAALIAALTATRKEPWSWPSPQLGFDEHNR